MIGFASVTLSSFDVGQARALSSHAITFPNLTLVRTQQIARAGTAILRCRISIESLFASLAVETFRVVKTLLAFSRLLIARARIVEVDVVVADARLAASSGCSRIAEVVIGAFVASGSGVAHFAVTSDLLRPGLCRIRNQRASVGKLLSGVQSSGTHARTARNA